MTLGLQNAIALSIVFLVVAKLVWQGFGRMIVNYFSSLMAKKLLRERRIKWAMRFYSLAQLTDK